MSADDIQLTDEQKELLHALNPRQQKFVCNLVSGMSQTQAYKEAGYNPRSDDAAKACATKLLTNAHVKSAYDSLIKPDAERYAAKAIMQRDEGLQILSEVGRAKFEDFFNLKEVEIDTMDGPETAIIAQLKNPDGLGERGNLALRSVTIGKSGSTKYEMYDRIQAIKTISEKDGWDKASDKDKEQTSTLIAFIGGVTDSYVGNPAEIIGNRGDDE